MEVEQVREEYVVLLDGRLSRVRGGLLVAAQLQVLTALSAVMMMLVAALDG